MASDKNPKEKSRKRHTDSEDEGKARKKNRSRDEDGGGSKKSKSTDSERRSGKEKKHKSEDSKHNRDFTEISSDDYFAKNNEFATWLKEEKKKFFSDLSTESARALFTEFAEEWNAHKLKSKFYKGIKTGPRSSHKWNISK